MAGQQDTFMLVLPFNNSQRPSEAIMQVIVRHSQHSNSTAFALQ
jgi:hypothetical protein